MVSLLISLLILALILFLIFYVVGMFMPGRPQQIVGIILGIIFLLIALQKLGYVGNL